MQSTIRIGTRESQLAVWQATLVQDKLAAYGHTAELVYIKSEGDIDLKTPLYEMGVQGIFTRSLDIALLNDTIDIAVHSMKDVPTQLPHGIVQAAVLERGNYKDLFVFHPGDPATQNTNIETAGYLELSSSLASTGMPGLGSEYAHVIATSSIRRKAQWLHRYPTHKVENLRGNVNTRLKKLEVSSWAGAIFAAAGLERINLRPGNAVELDWMLPAPAQGAIMVVSRAGDELSLAALAKLDHKETNLCTAIEKDFLRKLLGGCSTPISALAVPDNQDIFFRGSILTLDGKERVEIEKYIPKHAVIGFGSKMAIELLNNGGQEIADKINHEK